MDGRAHRVMRSVSLAAEIDAVQYIIIKLVVETHRRGRSRSAHTPLARVHGAQHAVLRAGPRREMKELHTTAMPSCYTLLTRAIPSEPVPLWARNTVIKSQNSALVPTREIEP